MLFFANLLLFGSVTSTSMSYFNIIKLNATPSTNDFLKERHQKGLCHDGDLVWAQDQTSGRGQRNRTWFSSPENSLTFSIYKTYRQFHSANAFSISAAVALAIVSGLQSQGIPNLSIKWPNDILSDNKKIAGILIENIFKQGNLKATFIGIGLNVNQNKFEDLPNAASLASVTSKQWDTNHVFNALKEPLENLLFSLNSISLKELFLNYSNLLWKKDERAVFEKEEEIFTAITRGVTSSGCILLEDETGKKIELNSSQLRMHYEN